MVADRPIVVLSSTTATNALGRALSVAELAMTASTEVQIYGPEDGPLWVGATQTEAPIKQFGSRGELVKEVAELGGRPLVWAIKPLRRSWGTAAAIARRVPVDVVLDVDDEDAALSMEFRARSLGNRLRVHPGRMLHPRQIGTTLRHARSAAAGFTYATEALAAALHLPTGPPRLRVPHPRHRESRPARRAGARRVAHIGCFGTLREHKGIDVLDELVTQESSITLHVFDTAPELLLNHAPGRVVTHSGTTPLAELYANLDVSLLPQGTSRGARLQLPAKLLDSMRFGVPVMATPTAAIEEIAGDAYYRVRDWADTDAVIEGVRKCAESGDDLGLAGKTRFDDDFSVEAQGPAFADFLTQFERPVGEGAQSRVQS
jgi:glycosyltransferase involved in cell wall biosynthesis